MILTFSKEQFKNKIQAGIKIHTIREDKANRWRMGKLIQHWLHNPRNVSKHPHQFGENSCTGTQSITISWTEFMFQKKPYVFIDDVKLTPDQVERLAINDGFESSKSFFAWFKDDIENWKIIHWTDFRY